MTQVFTCRVPSISLQALSSVVIFRHAESNGHDEMNSVPDSSVGIELGYGLDVRGSRVRFAAGARNFLFTTASRTDLGPTQPPIQWVLGAPSLGVKRPGREADHSYPSSADVRE
jgi:hypothetical protein